MSEYYKKNLKYKQTSYKKYIQSVSKKNNNKNVDYTTLYNAIIKCQNQYVRVYTIITVR